jgi:hypothetical protein
MRHVYQTRFDERNLPGVRDTETAQFREVVV